MCKRFWARWLFIAFTIFNFSGFVFAEASTTKSVSLTASISADIFIPLEERACSFMARNIEVREALMKICEMYDLSLLASYEVRGNIDEIASGTLSKVLNSILKSGGYSWRIWDNCLYVAEQSKLDRFFDKTSKANFLKLPPAKNFSNITGDIDIQAMFRILRKHAKIQITTTDSIRGAMAIRLTGVPWERVFLAGVYMNGLNLVVSDFSFTVTP